MVRPVQDGGKEPILLLSSKRLHTVCRKSATARNNEAGPSLGSEARGSSTPKDSAPDIAASSAGASDSTAANGEALNVSAAPGSSGASVYEQVLTLWPQCSISAAALNANAAVDLQLELRSRVNGRVLWSMSMELASLESAKTVLPVRKLGDTGAEMELQIAVYAGLQTSSGVFPHVWHVTRCSSKHSQHSRVGSLLWCMCSGSCCLCRHRMHIFNHVLAVSIQ